ncbi:hypothetical protein L484_009187 [Morus notabilis]|uniref:Uncharacterized protein n=1 Tax=Morus notabilis TaxID=981085 RepID=W9SDX0_9ROSA|nr:hypothetical protein L484_009184 [Morus notabilis]EXC27865.1 hypothetical protein L484_009187 [Morus notabilis]
MNAVANLKKSTYCLYELAQARLQQFVTIAHLEQVLQWISIDPRSIFQSTLKPLNELVHRYHYKRSSGA